MNPLPGGFRLRVAYCHPLNLVMFQACHQPLVMSHLTHALWRIGQCALALCLILVSTLTCAAMLPAGPATSPRAYAIFSAPVWGGEHRIDSNALQMQVQGVSGLALTAGSKPVAVPGDTVLLPFTLHNTGNAPAAYRFTARDSQGRVIAGLKLFLTQRTADGREQLDREVAMGEASVRGARLTVAADETARLAFQFEVPGKVDGEYGLTVHTETLDQGASAELRLSVTVDAALADVRVAQSASVTAVIAGGQWTQTFHAINVGKNQAGAMSRVHADTVMVDGKPMAAVLLRNVFDDAVVYVAGSLRGSAGTIALLRTEKDPPFHYRTKAPAADSEGRIVEVALAARRGLAPGQSMTGSWQARLADGVVQSRVNSDVDVAYGRSGHAQAHIVQGERLSLPFAYGASISGTVRLVTDTQAQGGKGQGLENWQAELVAWPTAQRATVVAQARTDAQGQYVIAGVVPGTEYGLRFRSPAGRLHGLGRDNRRQAGGEVHRDKRLAMLRFVRVESEQHYTDMDLELTPTGVVYDAVTRAPIAGALVSLKPGMPGFDAATDILGGADALTVTTDAHGYYLFDLTSHAPAGVYAFDVRAPGYLPGLSRLLTPETGPLRLEAGREQAPRVSAAITPPAVAETVRYYAAIDHAPGATWPVNNHLPMDAATGRDFQLFLEKQADRDVVERVDFVNYTLSLTHRLNIALPGFRVIDALPRGFTYVPGSATWRVGKGGRVAPLLATVQGAKLVFDGSDIDVLPGQQINIRYRVRVTSQAPEDQDAVNRARAYGGGLVSNEATASVKVSGGVFSDAAFVAGKVYLACGPDGDQGAFGMGMPGVRIYLEDGSYAETDRDGKYSLYGLKPITHVLKLDVSTLPAGATPLIVDNRNAGSPGSRFLDLKNGELGRGDFALACVTDAREAARVRRQALTDTEINTAVDRRFDVTPTAPTARSQDRPATGTIAATGPAAASVSTTAQALDRQATPSDNVAPGSTSGGTERLGLPGAQHNTPSASAQAPGTAAVPRIDPKVRVKQATGRLAFLSLANQQVVTTRRVSVMVEGTRAPMTLKVNGAVVPASQLGERAERPDRSVAVAEYVRVALQPGRNVLRLEQGGIARQITVIAPGKLAQLRLEMPESGPADGKSAVPVKVLAFDKDGVPVPDRVSVTLKASAGRWDVQNLDDDRPGTHTFIDGGSGIFSLLAPADPGDVTISAAAGVEVTTRGQIAFLPAMRPMVAVGIVEGVVTLRNGWIRPASGQSGGFERELSGLSRSWNQGRMGATSRTAFFLKGQVRGDYLLTAAYDSDKQVRDRIFRDIEPDKYYPVYGDSSLKGFDAQSTSKLYFRVDRGRSYLLYGDFSTSTDAELRQLTQYNRAVTGARTHIERGPVSATVFASHTGATQRVLQRRADGTSGPWRMLGADYVEDSETVEIITRQGGAGSLILKTESLTRHRDYDIDTLSGHLRLMRPVPTYDRDSGGTNYLRVSFESDGGGAKFWIVGADVQVKVSENVVAGALVVDDRNLAEPRRLLGATVKADIDEKTTVFVEAATTQSPDRPNGSGARAVVKHVSDKLTVGVEAVHTDRDYDNQSAGVAGGHDEVRATAKYDIDDKTRLKASLQKTRDQGASETVMTPDDEFSHHHRGKPDTLRAESGAVALERQLTPSLTGEVGVRRQRGTATTNDTTENLDLLSVHTRLTAQVAQVEGLSVYGEVEQDVHDSKKRTVAVGGDYAVTQATRVYGRQELVSGIRNIYDVDAGEKHYRSLLGVESQLTESSKAFAEYRDDASVTQGGRQAAAGIRNSWGLNDSWRLSSTFEHTRSLQSREIHGNEVATTARLDYLSDPNWRGNVGVELRRGGQSSSILTSSGLAYRPSSDWTLLARNATYQLFERDGDHAKRSRWRFRLGAAYRPSENNDFNGLAYYEERLDLGHWDSIDASRRQAHMLSAVGNWRLGRGNSLSQRFAFKDVNETGAGSSSRANAWLAQTHYTRDINRRWDIGLSGAVSRDSGQGLRTALGAEVGYLIDKDMWLSLGYNVRGFNDREFNDLAQTQQGVYVRFRYKFDEDLF